METQAKDTDVFLLVAGQLHQASKTLMMELEEQGQVIKSKKASKLEVYEFVGG